MFTQILRAFLSKAQQHDDDPNRWTGAANFRFVAEFLSHFRSIGYQLVRISDYENLDEFLGAIEALRDIDFLHEDARRQAVEECTEFFTYMDQLFAQISRRAELKEVPFDRHAAAETLKLLLGRGESLVGRLLLYDALAASFRELKIKRDPACPVCGDKPTIRDFIDYERACGAG